MKKALIAALGAGAVAALVWWFGLREVPDVSDAPGGAPRGLPGELTGGAAGVAPDATPAASAAGDPDPAMQGLPGTAPESAPGAAPAPELPRFDVVRVEPDGQTVVAGAALPDSVVEILLDGEVIATADADNAGNFVAVFRAPPSDAPRELLLRVPLPGAAGPVAAGPAPEGGTTVAAAAGTAPGADSSEPTAPPAEAPSLPSVPELAEAAADVTSAAARVAAAEAMPAALAAPADVNPLGAVPIPDHEPEGPVVSLASGDPEATATGAPSSARPPAVGADGTPDTAGRDEAAAHPPAAGSGATGLAPRSAGPGEPGAAEPGAESGPAPETAPVPVPAREPGTTAAASPAGEPDAAIGAEPGTVPFVRAGAAGAEDTASVSAVPEPPASAGTAGPEPEIAPLAEPDTGSGVGALDLPGMAPDAPAAPVADPEPGAAADLAAAATLSAVEAGDAPASVVPAAGVTPATAPADPVTGPDAATAADPAAEAPAPIDAGAGSGAALASAGTRADGPSVAEPAGPAAAPAVPAGVVPRAPEPLAPGRTVLPARGAGPAAPVARSATSMAAAAPPRDAEPRFLTSRPVVILPAAGAEEAPVVLSAGPDSVRVVQPPRRTSRGQVTLDSISYGDAGAVIVAGRSGGGEAIRIYLDGRPAGAAGIATDGSWQAELQVEGQGPYTLRVDELDAAGTVVSRAESPFARARLPEGALRERQIVVQPGNNLWTMAEQIYGEGLRYHTIFRANRGQIRDPDLIYPGQIFELPELEPEGVGQ